MVKRSPMFKNKRIGILKVRISSKVHEIEGHEGDGKECEEGRLVEPGSQGVKGGDHRRHQHTAKPK